MSKRSFYGLDFEELCGELSPAAASNLYNFHYKKKLSSGDYKDISKDHLAYIEKHFDFTLPAIHSIIESRDKTVKFLFEFKDGKKVEAVLLAFQNKYSLCLSSQVGCAMNCSFCFTGTQGLTRNLEAEEIVGQFLGAWDWLARHRPGQERILNIVFMGQGEPLHNFDAVKKACHILISKNGASLGQQKITISTSGYLPGLKRWKEEMPGVNLALSLHSPFDKKRDELIPLNKKFPLTEVLAYIDEIPLGRKQFITFEYLLIKDFNDSEVDARATGELLKDRRALINIIPFNPYPGSLYERPEVEKAEVFKGILEEYNLPIFIRGVKGDDVLAACGQLNSLKSTNQ